MRKFSLFGSVLVTGLLLGSCAAEVDLEEAAAVVKPAMFEKANMYYPGDTDSWLPISQAKSPNFIFWGVNGHPLNQEAYTDATDPVNTQLGLLKQLGMDYYRIDMLIDNNGIIVDYRQPRFNELVTNDKGVKILPVIPLQTLNFNLSAAVNKALGKQLGENFAIAYGTHFKYYEIGNEQDIKDSILCQGCDGSASGQYDNVKMQKLAEYFKGMIEGIKSKDGDAVTIIDIAGWFHYGFFDNIISKGVQFDITGLHYYSDHAKLRSINNGPVNMLQKLSSYGKPIWITEINRKFGSLPGDYANTTSSELLDSNKEIEQAKWIQNYIKEIDSFNLVQAFFIHELYDMPAFNDHSTAYGEAKQGITKWSNESDYNSVLIKKPPFNTTKFFIEETKHGYEDYIRALCSKLEPNVILSTTYVNSWSATLKGNNNKMNTVSEFMKQKYFKEVVKELYSTLLNVNTPDSGGWTYHENRLKNGTTSREGLIMDFCHSADFWSLSGSTNAGFVNRVFNKLLGRNPDSSYWTDEIESGRKTKGVFISETLVSDEYLNRYITAQYTHLHGRGPDPTELTYWRNQMKSSGLSQIDFVKKVVTHNEFWEKSIMKGYQFNTGFSFE